MKARASSPISPRFSPLITIDRISRHNHGLLEYLNYDTDLPHRGGSGTATNSTAQNPEDTKKNKVVLEQRRPKYTQWKGLAVLIPMFGLLPPAPPSVGSSGHLPYLSPARSIRTRGGGKIYLEERQNIPIPFDSYVTPTANRTHQFSPQHKCFSPPLQSIYYHCSFTDLQNSSVLSSFTNCTIAWIPDSPSGATQGKGKG